MRHPDDMKRRRENKIVLRHGRDVHPAWVNVVTAALALKSFEGLVMRAGVMLESHEGSGFETKSTKCDLDSFW
jgi:hypothetical protein